jgi:hypothetical protein
MLEYMLVTFERLIDEAFADGTSVIRFGAILSLSVSVMRPRVRATQHYTLWWMRPPLFKLRDL